MAGNYFDSNYTGSQIDAAINFVYTQVAEPFGNASRSSNYVLDDYCVYNGLLYQCINANGTSYSTFTAADWQVQKIFDNDGYVIVKGGTSSKNV